MDFKNNKLLYILGGVLSLLLLVTLYFLMGARSEHKKLVKQGDSLVANVNNLQREEISPDPANVKIAEENADFYADFLNQYSNKVWSANPKILNWKPEKFSAEVNALVSNLRNTERAKWKDTKVSGSFKMGFPRYFDGDEPEKEDLPRLTVQYQILRQMIVVLLQSKVTEILHFGREEFEGPPKGLFGQPANNAGPFLPPGGPQLFGQPNAKATPENEEIELWSSEHYKLDFVCAATGDQNADVSLRKVLNGINAIPYPVEIVKVALLNQGKRGSVRHVKPFKIENIPAEDMMEKFDQADRGSRQSSGLTPRPGNFGMDFDDNDPDEMDRALLLAAGDEQIRVHIELKVYDRPNRWEKKAQGNP